MKKRNDISIGVVCCNNETDFFVAKNICRKLNSYRPPAYNGRKVRFACRLINFEVARQQSSLAPADYPEWLIIVCSPQLKASEINVGFINGFVALNGLDRVAMCIAQGEPNEVFPDCLKQRKIITFLPDGSRTVSIEEIEPLAADFRAENNTARYQLIKNNYLKLASLVLSVRYDDLKQRRKMNSRTRRKRTLQILCGVYGLVLAAVLIVAYRSAVTTTNKKDEVRDYTNMQMQKALIYIEYGEYDKAWEPIKDALQLIEEYDSATEGEKLINKDALFECGYMLFPYDADWSMADEEVEDIPENGSGYSMEIITADESPYMINYYCSKATGDNDGWKVTKVIKIQKDDFYTSKCFFEYPNGNYVLATIIEGFGELGRKAKKYYSADDPFSIEDGAAAIDTYLGTDNDGVSYFKGGDEGYIIAPNGKLLATLDYLYRVDYENEKLVLKKENEYLKMDILTYEKICEKMTALMADAGVVD